MTLQQMREAWAVRVERIAELEVKLDKLNAARDSFAKLSNKHNISEEHVYGRDILDMFAVTEVTNACTKCLDDLIVDLIDELRKNYLS